MRHGERCLKKRGFSLVEMLLAIGLSGAILVSAMTLMLSFAHIYVSSREFEPEIERDIFAKKLITMLLTCYKSSEECGNVDESLLDFGIFFKTNNVPIFVDVNRGNSFIIGLIKDEQRLDFVWKNAKKDTEFEHLKLFDGVKRICISSYDLETDSWLEHEFA
ncbi:MAG: type II secretion system GspH family protein, partial [Puniceicoccales bacterium]|nr:type II secretion system GspH family protein [Puniceicoccales bacterium]